VFSAPLYVDWFLIFDIKGIWHLVVHLEDLHHFGIFKYWVLSFSFFFAIPLFCALLMLVAYKLCALLTQLLLTLKKSVRAFSCLLFFLLIPTQFNLSSFFASLVFRSLTFCSTCMDFLFDLKKF
jgi:hypothetical protein